MCKNLKPHYHFHKVTQIPFSDFQNNGYKFALLDLDNTIAPDHVVEPTEYTYEVIKLLQSNGFTCCLVSNAKSMRSMRIAEKLGVQCVPFAAKPSPKGILSALSLLNADKEATLMIGDQLFTDIVAGNRAGVTTIWVDPYNKKEVLYVKIKRPFERMMGKIMRF